MAADVEESFAERLLFRVTEPKLVVGTPGLVSAAWHRSYEHYGSMSLQSAFEKQAERVIIEAD